MRATKNKIEFYTDFSELAKFIGAGKALAQSEDDQLYLEHLAQAAFNHAEEAFNMEAAATAAAGAKIKHMFEWGTAGINRGRTNMRPNPNSERARLWGTNLAGHGLSQTYSYYFKPSVAYVPKPTVGATGMSAQTIALLKNHIFWNKAEVFETGMTVTIRPKGDNLLLIPAYKGLDTSGWRPADRKRGYIMNRGPNEVTPGGPNTAGQFTGFWTTYWEGTGQELIDEQIEKYFEEDFLADLEVNRPNGLRPAMPGAIKEMVVMEQKRVARNARKRAAYRAKKDEAPTT